MRLEVTWWDEDRPKREVFDDADVMLLWLHSTASAEVFTVTKLDDDWDHGYDTDLDAQAAAQHQNIEQHGDWGW